MRNAQQLLADLSAGRWDAAFASLYGCAGRSAADCRARYARLVEGFTAAFGDAAAQARRAGFDLVQVPGGAIAAVNSDGTTEEVYGTCVKEAGVTYVSRSALAQALDLYLAD